MKNYQKILFDIKLAEIIIKTGKLLQIKKKNGTTTQT